jgi:hypothetical protein
MDSLGTELPPLIPGWDDAGKACGRALADAAGPDDAGYACRSHCFVVSDFKL